VLAVIVILVFLFVQSTAPHNTVVIDNPDTASNLSSDNIKEIAQKVYNSIDINNKADIYHSVIRDGSYTYKDSTVTFIVDIESIKASFKVVVTVDSNSILQGDIGILCVDKDQEIYSPALACTSTGFEDITQSSSNPDDSIYYDLGSHLPITTSDYSINYGRINSAGNYVSDGQLAVVVTLYTPDAKNKALAAISDLGYDINKLNFYYISDYSN